MPNEGLNYCLRSRELDVRDAVSTYGLSSPDRICDYLGITRTFLLTWLGPGVEPLNLNWLADYRLQVSRLVKMGDLRSNEEAYRHVYDQRKTNPTWGISAAPPSPY